MSITIEKVLMLKQMPLFKAVSNLALSDLIAISEEQTLKKGEVLIEAEEQNKDLYCILSGVVEREKNQKTEILSAQSIVGLNTVFWIANADENVTVKQEAVVLKIGKEKLYRMMALHPSLAVAVLHELSALSHA